MKIHVFITLQSKSSSRPFSVFKIVMQMVDLVLGPDLAFLSFCSRYPRIGLEAFVDFVTSFMIIKDWT